MQAPSVSKEESFSQSRSAGSPSETVETWGGAVFLLVGWGCCCTSPWAGFKEISITLDSSITSITECGPDTDMVPSWTTAAELAPPVTTIEPLLISRRGRKFHRRSRVRCKPSRRFANENLQNRSTYLPVGLQKKMTTWLMSSRTLCRFVCVWKMEEMDLGFPFHPLP